MQITSETVYRLYKQLEAKAKEEDRVHEEYTNLMKEAYLTDEHKQERINVRDHLNHVRFEIARIAEQLLPIMRVAATYYEEENAVLLRGSDNGK